jgi:signal transduction histidine kinase
MRLTLPRRWFPLPRRWFPLPPRWVALPRRTLRLRLTLLYSALFLVSGAGLLTFTYLLVDHTTGDRYIFSSSTSSGGGSASASTGLGDPMLMIGGGLDGLTATQQQAQLAQLQTQAVRQHAAELNQLLTWSGVALAIMSVIAVVLGWLVAGRVLRPLRTITSSVRDISATNLHERLALAGPHDELKELADTFDGLLERLDSAFRAQRQFVANASHELRTPLARQRTLGQVALADPEASVGSLRAAHERVLVAGAQQERIIEALLTLARGSAGIDRHERLDLANITDTIVAARTHEAQHLGIHVSTSLSAAICTGDPRLVERLIANLVDNALRHNTPDGHVDIRTLTRSGQAVLSISNSGPAIPPDAIGGLFQPFRRLHPDRTGRSDGVGLGLSIVHAIAETHRGRITARARTGGGMHIEIAFPAHAATDNHASVGQRLDPRQRLPG